MKNKEINLSKSSLEEKEEKQESVKEYGDVTKKEKKDRFVKLKQWWNKAPKYKKILLIAIPALIILGGSIFFVYQTVYGPRTQVPQLIDITDPYLAPNTKKEDGIKFANLKLAEPSVPRTEESPINGRLFSKSEMEEMKERRPVGVIINNHPSARPTSNLQKADIIFETLVEGGATRMLGIFWSNEVEKVGPIRSARQYFLEWLSPFDPLFVYDGQASTNDPRTDAGGNISAYNIKTIGTRGAWRVSDRSAPHDEYSSVKEAWEYAEGRGWDGFPNVESWEFKPDAQTDDREERSRVEVNFSNSSEYAVSWEYNRSSNRYLRSVGGSSDTDYETDKQLYAKNVIIQEVNIEGPVDEYNRLIIDVQDSGNAKIFRDGETINGTWEKDSRTGRTKYYDQDGDEIEFNRGLTWVQALPNINSRVDIN